MKIDRECSRRRARETDTAPGGAVRDSRDPFSRPSPSPSDPSDHSSPVVFFPRAYTTAIANLDTRNCPAAWFSRCSRVLSLVSSSVASGAPSVAAWITRDRETRNGGVDVSRLKARMSLNPYGPVRVPDKRYTQAGAINNGGVKQATKDRRLLAPANFSRINYK